jgi:hypothetical protein
MPEAAVADTGNLQHIVIKILIRSGNEQLLPWDRRKVTVIKLTDLEFSSATAYSYGETICFEGARSLTYRQDIQ